jgi:hypothetical protein
VRVLRKGLLVVEEEEVTVEEELDVIALVEA